MVHTSPSLIKPVPKSTLKSRPPLLSDEDKARAAEAFIDAAGQGGGAPGPAMSVAQKYGSATNTGTPPTEPRKPQEVAMRQPPPVYPWQEAHVREDVKKTFNLRFPEPLMLKLQYISEHTVHSMHSFCIEVLEPAIDAEIDRITEQ